MVEAIERYLMRKKFPVVQYFLDEIVRQSDVTFRGVLFNFVIAFAVRSASVRLTGFPFLQVSIIYPLIHFHDLYPISYLLIENSLGDCLHERCSREDNVCAHGCIAFPRRKPPGVRHNFFM